jgi:uncharacterized protein YjbI with pentapeptide repeats
MDQVSNQDVYEKNAFENFGGQLKGLWKFLQSYWVTIIVVVLGAMGLIWGLFLYFGGWYWTGVYAFETVSWTDPRTQIVTQLNPGKTLWDLLDLIIIPLVLGIVAYFFNKQQKEVELENAKKERKNDQQIAQDRIQEDTLQNYLDRITKLIQEGLSETEENRPLQIIARAHTLTAVRQLNEERKGILLRFLRETDLINKNESKIITFGIDFSNVNMDHVKIGHHQYRENLKAVNLSAANLSGSSFVGANLEESELHSAILIDANLSEANLNKASLWMAHLNNANLRDADLSEARLNSTNLTKAILTNAKLVKAVLSGANLTEANLLGAKLNGADLSNANLSRINSQWYKKTIYTLPTGDFSDTDLRGADLSEAFLDGVYFSNADMSRANLNKAN